MLPPLGTLGACMVLFLGMVGGGRVRSLPLLSPVGGQRVPGGSRGAGAWSLGQSRFKTL